MTENAEYVRCYAVQGTARSGPAYCGYPAKTEDANGRPVCLIHKAGNPGIAWYGNQYRYPEGTGGRWSFVHGEPSPTVREETPS